VALAGTSTGRNPAVTQSSPIVLASGQISRSGDPITVELIQPDSLPAAVRIVWPTAPTITTPARYNEVASTAMRLLAEASTMLARQKQANGCNGLAA
jgi:hypothetical protein